MNLKYQTTFWICFGLFLWRFYIKYLTHPFNFLDNVYSLFWFWIGGFFFSWLIRLFYADVLKTKFSSVVYLETKAEMIGLDLLDIEFAKKHLDIPEVLKIHDNYYINHYFFGKLGEPYQWILIFLLFLTFLEPILPDIWLNILLVMFTLFCAYHCFLSWFKTYRLGKKLDILSNQN